MLGYVLELKLYIHNTKRGKIIAIKSSEKKPRYKCSTVCPLDRLESDELWQMRI
jgi:hypothetical protein